MERISFKDVLLGTIAVAFALVVGHLLFEGGVGVEGGLQP